MNRNRPLFGKTTKRKLFCNILILFIAILVLWILWLHHFTNILTATNAKHETDSKSKQFFFHEGRIIYEIPQAVRIKGTLFIAHACTHAAHDFWVWGPHCQDCIGLSEEAMIVSTALELGYVVVAINSTDRKSGCWSDSESDTSFVQVALQVIRTKYKLLNLPLFSLGTSSGGHFVWKMACRGEIDGAVIQVMSVDISKCSSSLKDHPAPIVLNAMRRDRNTFDAMYKNFQQLESIVKKDYVTFQECSPLIVSRDYLMNRLPFIDAEMATSIVIALNNSGFIDSETGYLIKDPTAPDSTWRNVLLDYFRMNSHDLGLVLEKGRSPLGKALNRAWAFHEYCADYIAPNLKWMEHRYVART
jgi:hypothetical protein